MKNLRPNPPPQAEEGVQKCRVCRVSDAHARGAGWAEDDLCKRCENVLFMRPSGQPEPMKWRGVPFAPGFVEAMRESDPEWGTSTARSRVTRSDAVLIAIAEVREVRWTFAPPDVAIVMLFVPGDAPVVTLMALQFDESPGEPKSGVVAVVGGVVHE